ncbi:MAG: hypothetical protein ACLFQK_03900 [Fibrobacterota bacterium]
MEKIVRKIAWILGVFVFLLLTVIGVFSMQEFSFSILPLIFLKASTGFIIFWLFGIIVSDTVIKAIVSSVKDTDLEKWEGGIVSRFVPDPAAAAGEKNNKEDTE